VVAERVVASLPSWTTGDQKRHRSPVALVGGAVGRPQPVLLVHRTKDDIEGHVRQQHGSVRRHARQEQKESQSTVVGGVELGCRIYNSRVKSSSSCRRTMALLISDKGDFSFPARLPDGREGYPPRAWRHPAGSGTLAGDLFAEVLPSETARKGVRATLRARVWPLQEGRNGPK
jgi:hypothetical protein